jgi:bifunctional DNA-binding transcriptional regulator/antitoxin component of YhaV-PrlF toxin-antitoxin module
VNRGPRNPRGARNSAAAASVRATSTREETRSVPGEPSKVGKRGTVVLPAALRPQFGIEEGSAGIAAAREDGILSRPVTFPIEIYTPERKAEFLLSNSLDREDLAAAVRRVRSLGLDPDRIPHSQPPGV